MTKLEYARLRIDEILIELPENDIVIGSEEIADVVAMQTKIPVKKLAEDYEIIPKEGEIF